MLEARPTSPPTTVWSLGGSRSAGRVGVAILLTLPGCGVAPSVNILGSFFPAWLICIVVGVVLTVLTRQVFVATGIAPDVGPAALVYPCLAGVWIFATWLLVFAG
jgi:hypothetical protein